MPVSDFFQAFKKAREEDDVRRMIHEDWTKQEAIRKERVSRDVKKLAQLVGVDTPAAIAATMIGGPAGKATMGALAGALSMASDDSNAMFVRPSKFFNKGVLTRFPEEELLEVPNMKIRPFFGTMALRDALMDKAERTQFLGAYPELEYLPYTNHESPAVDGLYGQLATHGITKLPVSMMTHGSEHMPHELQHAIDVVDKRQHGTNGRHLKRSEHQMRLRDRLASERKLLVNKNDSAKNLIASLQKTYDRLTAKRAALTEQLKWRPGILGNSLRAQMQDVESQINRVLSDMEQTTGRITTDIDNHPDVGRFREDDIAAMVPYDTYLSNVGEIRARMTTGEPILRSVREMAWGFEDPFDMTSRLKLIPMEEL